MIPAVTPFMREKMIHYLLIALILGFFVIPLATFCFFDCNFFFVHKKITSILLFFFR